jgi:hypothetical protein
MSFQKVLTEAVRDFTEHGYDDPQRLDEWLRRLYEAAESDLPSERTLEKRMKQAMEAVFSRSFSKTQIDKKHSSVPRYTIDRIRVTARPELTRRILASADLIKLNRGQAIDKTLQRFSGWATSIPDGGSRVVEKTDVKADIGKSMRQMRYEERRVTIDQGHKLMASIDAVIANDSGAIAMRWRSHWRDPHYNYRKDHKERDQKVYAIRGNWAMQKGLMNKGEDYSDNMTQPAEEPFCQCYGVYIYHLRDLPDEMLTQKGRDALSKVSGEP